jgi:hypothetical protein
MKPDPNKQEAPKVPARPIDDSIFEPLGTSLPVRFIERRTYECAWPLWTDETPQELRECCGARTEPKAPYCRTHLTLSEMPPLPATAPVKAPYPRYR